MLIVASADVQPALWQAFTVAVRTGSSAQADPGG
jgi:hypothetical protein